MEDLAELGDASPEVLAELHLDETVVHAHAACLNERGWGFLEPGVETRPLTMAPRQPGFVWDDAVLADQRECQQLAGMVG